MADFCGGLHKAADEDPVVAFVDPNTDASKYMHHWAQGPRNVERLSTPIERRMTGGTWEVFGWRYLAYLDPELPEGLAYEMVRERLKQVWQSELGWTRAGVWIAMARSPEKASGIVRISSASGGNEGCRNCQSCSCVWTQWGQKDRMYLLSTHLGNDWILNHEAGHMVFNCCDMYLRDATYSGGGGYGGVMDAGFDSTTWPTAHDIFDAREWLEGRAPYPVC